jgi:hypothetical protein
MGVESVLSNVGAEATTEAVPGVGVAIGAPVGSSTIWRRMPGVASGDGDNGDETADVAGGSGVTAA